MAWANSGTSKTRWVALRRDPVRWDGDDGGMIGSSMVDSMDGGWRRVRECTPLEIKLFFISRFAAKTKKGPSRELKAREWASVDVNQVIDQADHKQQHLPALGL